MCLGYDGNYADLRGTLLCKMHWGKMIGLKKLFEQKIRKDERRLDSNIEWVMSNNPFI